jgi:hypothetical protein
MQQDTPESEFPDYIGVRKYRCPNCDAKLIRTARRPIDRLLSLFVPQLRFRCTRFQCQWVGNIRMDEASHEALKNQSHLSQLR